MDEHGSEGRNGRGTGSRKLGGLLAVLLLAGGLAGVAAGEPHRGGHVLRFHVRTARCEVAGSTRPVAVTLACA